MEEILREILNSDKNLLSRRDELIAILDDKVPGRLMREYTPIKRALMLNIGEIFAVGNSDHEAAINKAIEILKQSGLQENKINDVIEIFVKVLGWDKKPIEPVEEKNIPPKKVLLKKVLPQNPEIISTQTEKFSENNTVNDEEIKPVKKIFKASEISISKTPVIIPAQTEKIDEDKNLNQDNQFLKEYNLLLEKTGYEAKTARDAFIEKYKVRGFTCANFNERINQPTLAPVFESYDKVQHSDYWAIPISGNKFKVVPNVKNYNENYHTARAMGEVFNSNFYSGNYAKIQVEDAAEFIKSGDNWSLCKAGKIYLETKKNLKAKEKVIVPEWMNSTSNNSESKSTPPPVQVYHSTAPSPQPTPPVKNDSNILKGIIAVLVVALLIIFNNKSDNSNSARTNSNPVTSQTQTQQQSENYRNARTDLSLNGIDLGLPFDDVIKIFGEPDSIQNDGDNYYRFFYDGIEVVFKNDYLVAFISKSKKYKTYRGLTIGATYSEFVEQYGVDYLEMDLDDLTLYEYPFTAINGQKGLLRFALSKFDCKVSYISVRILEPEPEKPKFKNNIPENVKQAATAFWEYHAAITAGNYRKAYDMLTPYRQKYMGNFSEYTQGFANTISSKISDLKLVSNNGDSVTMEYTLDAKDRAGGGKFLYQQFKGQVEMVRVGNVWKIHSGKSSKVSERTGT